MHFHAVCKSSSPGRRVSPWDIQEKVISMGHQAAHSSNRRMISMSLHPNRMSEPHNMKGTP